jgi:hypothetical protein
MIPFLFNSPKLPLDFKIRMYKYLILLATLSFGCKSSSPEQQIQTQRFPNDDAPLALLMREMYEDMEEIRISVEKGEQIKSYLEKHRELLTVRGTDPEKSQQANFQVMGSGYLQSLEAMEKAEGEELESAYQILLSGCLACHTNYCPGPIKRINKLY